MVVRDGAFEKDESQTRSLRQSPRIDSWWLHEESESPEETESTQAPRLLPGAALSTLEPHQHKSHHQMWPLNSGPLNTGPFTIPRIDNTALLMTERTLTQAQKHICKHTGKHDKNNEEEITQTLKQLICVMSSNGFLCLSHCSICFLHLATRNYSNCVFFLSSLHSLKCPFFLRFYYLSDRI